jgi:peptidoglycan/LPS O-acetylase OafA/YrhL
MKLKYIDALRGVAIVGVLMVHCGQTGSNENLPSFLQSVILNGAYGVQLFYVASAFTLFLSLAHRDKAHGSIWFDFFTRRFFRIAPMYYLGICYYLWQDGLGPRYWLGDQTQITEWNVLSNVFFVHGFNPYWMTSVVPGGWSIAVEMLFYCLVPVLFIYIKNTQQAFSFVLLSLFFRALLQFVLLRVHLIESARLWMEFINFYLPAQLPVFALGILFYFIVKENYRLSLSPYLLLIAFLVCAAHLAGIPLLPNHFLFGIAFVLLGLALSRTEFKLFVNRVVTRLGRISYSMYLVHFAVLYWLAKMGAVDFVATTTPLLASCNYLIRLFTVVVVSAWISFFFYNAVELPMQRLGKRFIRSFREGTVGGQVVDGMSGLNVLQRSASLPQQSGHLTDTKMEGAHEK